MPCLGIGRIPTALRSAVMEESNRACYVHYNHADPCSAARWTAKESYEFMYGRPWQTVSDFYSELVRGGGYALLASLFPTEQKHESQELTENFEGWEDKKSASVSTNKTGRWARVTFKIILSYHGKSFEGWQKQPGLDTVQSLVEKSLGKFVDEKKAQHLRSQSLPVDGCAVVAGRTDKGVTALQQVCSFYTWRKDVTKGDIEDAINNAAPGKLRALYISEVSRVFHPNFSAKWRRYLYIFPLSSGQEDQTSRSEGDSSITSDDSNDNYEDEQVRYDKEDDGMVTIWNTAEDENYYSARKARNFSISKMNQLLCQLEGKCLSYRMFARDTKASRSIGPPTECFMFHARATETGLPCANEAYNGQRVMCVELVANRFLRKMVRVLVATAIREAAAGADDDALIKLMDATCRRATAPPAPPDGLCLVDVGYGDFKQEYCLIL